MKNYLFLLILFFGYCSYAFCQRITENLELWKFSRDDQSSASMTQFDDSNWESVKVPHDWAIYGPFDESIDRQIVKVVQNNEEEATEKTGRTGALPFIGAGWYRTSFSLDESSDGKQVLLAFDGAMSNAVVYVNGVKAGERPYGYSYFYFDVTDLVQVGEENTLAVRLENQPFSSRWYPGAGLYRKVQLIVKNPESFKHWGHYITTPFVTDNLAKVNIRSQVQGEDVRLVTRIKNAEGKVVAENQTSQRFADEIEQYIAVEKPVLWSPDQPYLYTAEIRLFQGEELKDAETIRFGIRTIKYSAEKGFELNGKVTKFKGVCLHHDLGPLGAAINIAALKRQLTILKDMGL